MRRIQVVFFDRINMIYKKKNLPIMSILSKKFPGKEKSPVG